MQVKVTPLNFNEVTREFEASSNVSYPQLAEGRLRLRVAFLPMNEQQHEMLAKLLPESVARIVNGSADPLLRITREDEVARLQPGQAPKVHVIGSPLFVDIEIGPRALTSAPSGEAEAAAEAPQPAATAASAGPDTPAANTAPAPPTDAHTAPPAKDSAGLTEGYGASEGGIGGPGAAGYVDELDDELDQIT